MSTDRFAVCEVCKKQIQVRSSMVHETLHNHMKEHK
jgi:hypothetical protein